MNNNKTTIQSTLLAAALGLTVLTQAPLALADEITDAMDSGIQKYKDGDMSGAAGQLDYAATLMRQKKAENAVSVFPDPLDGWEADDAESKAAGAAMFGGGISASRSYSSDDRQLTIELVMDSPVLQSMIGMFNNPSMIAMQGGKLTQINGINAMLKEENGEVQIVFVANNNALFTLTGNSTTVDEVKAYAKALKLDTIK